MATTRALSTFQPAPPAPRHAGGIRPLGVRHGGGSGGRRLGLIGGLVALLRPLVLVLVGLVAAGGALWVGTGYVRSWQRHADYALATHPDGSVVALDVARQVPDDAVTVGYRDAAGAEQLATASAREADAFAGESARTLEADRRQALERLDDEIAGLFATVFGDADERVRGFADWYFAWGRSWDLLWQGTASTATRLAEVRVETLREAVGRDVTDYLLRNFREQVLRPEFRDAQLKDGVRRALVAAHDRYLAAVRQQDLRLQLFLAQRTTHLGPAPAGAAGGLRVAFDWDAQRWKAPTYLMQDRALDGARSALVVGLGGTAGAALGQAIERAVAGALGRAATAAAAGVAARAEAGTAGAAAGSVVPGVGTALGAAGGLLAATGVDYAWNKGREWADRPAFEARNREALVAVRDEWRGKVGEELDRVVAVWFDDALAALGRTTGGG